MVASSAVRAPFIWYGKAFLRITAAISRREEFAADRCAVDRVGRDAHVAALRSINGKAAAFDSYWRNEIVPVLQAGRRAARRPRASPASWPTRASATPPTPTWTTCSRPHADPYDSHPSLSERIAAVEAMPAGRA